MLFFVIEKDREDIVRNHALDVICDSGQKAVEIEGFRRNCRNFEKKVEEFGAFLELDALTLGDRHRDYSTLWMMLTLALAPTRLAPAATIFRKSARVRIPPEALTPISGPHRFSHQGNVASVAPDCAESPWTFSRNRLRPLWQSQAIRF